VATTFERAYFNDVSLFRDEERRHLLSPELGARLDGHDPFVLFAQHFAPVRDQDRLSQLLYVDLKTWLPNDILVKVDRMSMASSLEVRAPFLDHRLIEFAATVPSHLKYRGAVSKYLVKRYLEGRVPAAAVHRRKQGFEIPLAAWLRGELRPLAEDLILSPRLLARGYFRPEHLRRLCREHQGGQRDHASRIWALMVLELWHRTFVDQAPARAT
jgi:asparagine synthase (glutamine-hydrolysing)